MEGAERTKHTRSQCDKILAHMQSGKSISQYEAFGGIWDNIKKIFSGVADFFSGIFQGAADAIKTIFDTVIGFIKAPINFLIDGINLFIGGLNKIQVPDWVPAIGGKGINIPLLKECYTVLPSVNPQEPRTGHWIEHNTPNTCYYDCSLCGCVAPCTEFADSYLWKLSNFCPDCGAKMVEPQEEGGAE